METCPCGSAEPEIDCCTPIRERAKQAPTAEALMRSRYTAFVRGDVDWIMESHHPDTVGEIDRDEVGRWSTESEWLGLRIKSTEGGGIDDAEGMVEFRARYRAQGQTIDHAERAHFERSEGEWRFHSVVEDDGLPELVPVTPRASVGRNDPCTCGSGRKYKKCCGAAA
jgi:SEC-C motif-containing protein